MIAAEASAPWGPAATVIVVDTSADLDSGSITKTCGFTSGVYVAATDGCTLAAGDLRGRCPSPKRPPH
ncbi:MAG: hypothetical protein R2867_44150 [Caldilineaceae bacterium]